MDRVLGISSCVAPTRISLPQCAVSGSGVDRYVQLNVLASRALTIGLIGASLQSRAIRGGVAQRSALLSVPPAGGWRVSLLCRARHCQGSWQLGGAYFFAPGGRRQCWSANPWWMRLETAVGPGSHYRYSVRATQKEKTVIGISQNFLVWVAFLATILYRISMIPAKSSLFRNPQFPRFLSVI